MKIIPIIILSIFLQGCASFKKPDIVINTPSVVTIDTEILQLCPLLKEDAVISSFEDSITVYADLATAYGICAKKQSNSVKLLKQFGNIK